MRRHAHALLPLLTRAPSRISAFQYTRLSDHDFRARGFLSPVLFFGLFVVRNAALHQALPANAVWQIPTQDDFAPLATVTCLPTGIALILIVIKLVYFLGAAYFPYWVCGLPIILQCLIVAGAFAVKKWERNCGFGLQFEFPFFQTMPDCMIGTTIIGSNALCFAFAPLVGRSVLPFWLFVYDFVVVCSGFHFLLPSQMDGYVDWNWYVTLSPLWATQVSHCALGHGWPVAHTAGRASSCFAQCVRPCSRACRAPWIA